MTGIELKLARVRLGRTQWVLALQLGMHPARVSEMERSQRPVPDEVAVQVRELEAAAAGTVDA